MVIVIKMSSSLLSKIAFYPTLVYNIFLSKVTSRNWYDRIDDTVVLGALPLTGVAKKVKYMELILNNSLGDQVSILGIICRFNF